MKSKTSVKSKTFSVEFCLLINSLVDASETVEPPESKEEKKQHKQMVKARPKSEKTTGGLRRLTNNLKFEFLFRRNFSWI